MGKRMFLGDEAFKGDFILNEITGERWVAQTCDKCLGSKVVPLPATPWIGTMCPTCRGEGLVWKKA